MPQTIDSTARIARRDWLKTTAFGGVSSLLAAATSPAQSEKPSAGNVRGVIFMVSDGMSPGVLTLAESHSKISRKQGTAWWKLIHDQSAACGLMDTASANSLVTDSAAASSAWGGGQRVNNGAINTDASGKAIPPIAAILKQLRPNAKVGLVTTATVTHATPAGFAACVTARGKEPDIAPQYLDRVDVILGGGSGFFDPKQRPDKRDLRGDFIQAGYQAVSDRDSLLASKSERLLGTFTPGHLPFSVDRDHDPDLAKKVPTLKEMAMCALSRFLTSGQPFLLQIEGARVDHAAHLNDIAGLLGDQLAFDDAVAAVLARTAGLNDILVVVTSDHGNANPGINGTGVGYGESTQRFSRISRMKASHERIFAEWGRMKARDAAQLTALIRQHLDYTLKSDEAEALLAELNDRHAIEWNHQLRKPEGLLGQFSGNHTSVGWTGTSHTSDPTIVTATGPRSDRFGGLVVNTDVFKHLREALC